MQEKELLCYSEEDKTIVIRMDLIYERPDIAYMNNFKINRRSYYKCVDLIVKDYNIIIEHYQDFLLYLLDIKYENKVEGNSDNIIEKINEIIEDDNLFLFIEEYVDKNYTLNLDSYININDKNLEYALDDEKNKIILKTSMVARLLIPIICETNLKEKDIYFILTNIMKRFDGDTMKTVRKLYKFIELRVQRTIYSDKVIWNYLNTRSVDPQLFIRTLNKSIVNNILTKLDHNKSAISFLDVVIREKIRFLFTYNYQYNVRSIKSSEQEMEDKEKLEIYMIKHDKAELLLHKISIEQEIKDIVIPEEFEYLNEIHNPYVTKFLEIYYADKFNPLFAEPVERTKLIIKMRNELLDYNYEIIPRLLVANIIKNEKRLNNRKKLNEKIIGSDKYMEFLHNYENVLNIIDKNNPVLQLVTIKNNKFVDKNEEEIEIPLEEFSSEILDLIQ